MHLLSNPILALRAPASRNGQAMVNFGKNFGQQISRYNTVEHPPSYKTLYVSSLDLQISQAKTTKPILPKH